MINWLARLFGGADKGKAHNASPAKPATSPRLDAPARQGPDSLPTAQPVAAKLGDTPSPTTAALTPHDLDRLFFLWLTSGQATLSQPVGTDSLILENLRRLSATPAEAANLVPRVPAVIPQLLRSLRDESSSGADLSRLLAQDVVLVAEVIREANTPYYRSTSQIKTLEGAIMLLGQNGMRMLLARVAFRPIINMQAGYHAKLVAPRLWSHADKCAAAASQLATARGANPFEAYLAGLIQNIGLIVAFRVIDQLQGEAPVPDSDAFCDQLMREARVLAAGIALQWEFPLSVAQAIASSSESDPAPLPATLALADRLAKLRLLVEARQLSEDDERLKDGLPSDAQACFAKLRTEEDA